MSAKPPETFGIDRLQTPIGVALLVTDAEGVLRALDWEDYAPRMKELLRFQYGAVVLLEARAPKDLVKALSGYFKGDLDRLGTIHWRVAGTPFQQKVWSRTCKWLKPDQRGRALPSPDRRQRHAGQIWRRPFAQKVAAGARRCGAQADAGAPYDRDLNFPA